MGIFMSCLKSFLEQGRFSVQLIHSKQQALRAQLAWTNSKLSFTALHLNHAGLPLLNIL